MKQEQQPTVQHRELAALHPLEYEIRVRGRLDGEQWRSWFEGITVMAEENNTTVLRAPLPDQAALYGLLARLRDLAVPLVSITPVMDAPPDKQRGNLMRFVQRTNWLLIFTYLLLAGGIASLTVYMSTNVMDTALALAFMFGLLAGIAAAFTQLADRGRGWLVLVWVWGFAAVLTFSIFTMTSGLIDTALGIGILLIVPAGLLLYVIYRRQQANQVRVLDPIDSPVDHSRK